MKKNLIIFIPSIEEGGVEKNLYIISNYFSKKGVNVKILTCNLNKKKYFNNNIKIIGTKSKFWFNKSRKIKYFICLLYLLQYLIKSSSNNLVFSFQANIYAILISKVTLTKIITRSNSSPSGWSKNFFKKFFYFLIIKLADDVVVNSNQFKREFKEEFNINAKCILNPFDNNFFQKIKKKYKKTKTKYIKILSIGRLTKQKDHMTLLKAAKLLKNKLKFKITIVGKGENYLNLKNFIKYNKLNKQVELIGYKSNIEKYFFNSDIFVLTSKYEGLPNVLLEAQYFKKYIISTNCPTGPKEILLNGKAGDLIEIGDYKQLSKLIYGFSTRKKIIMKKIQVGAKYFSRFDYEKNCKNYFNFIKKNF